MPSFLAPLHEFNQCHAPGGSPEGGQFCSSEADPRGVHVPLDAFVGVVSRGFKPDPALKIRRKARGDRWDVQFESRVKANADLAAEAGSNIGAKVRRDQTGDLYKVEVQGLPR